MPVTSAAVFASTYLQEGGPLPKGQRHQVAGPLYAFTDQLNRGASAATAQAAVNTRRTTSILHKAMAASNPYQATLAADFYTLTTV